MAGGRKGKTHECESTNICPLQKEKSAPQTKFSRRTMDVSGALGGRVLEARIEAVPDPVLRQDLPALRAVPNRLERQNEARVLAESCAMRELPHCMCGRYLHRLRVEAGGESRNSPASTLWDAC